jgi:hypothetical protein
MTGGSIDEFGQTFPDERSCAAYLFERRWPNGFVCPNCCGTRAASLKSRAYTYECLDCRRQTSITAGTVLHRSRLPLTLWFSAAYVAATNLGRISAREIERRLNIAYQTAWMLKRKLLLSDVARDAEPLQGIVEINRFELSRFSAPSLPSTTRTIIVAMAHEVPDDRSGGAKPAPLLHNRRVRLAAVDDTAPESVEDFVRAHVKHGTTLLSYGDKPYLRIPDYIPDYGYVSRRYGTIVSQSCRVLSALNDWFANRDNFKDNLVKNGLEQLTADLNWRGAFEAILGLAVEREPTTYWDLVGYENPRRGIPTTRRQPRRRKTEAGMREDGSEAEVELEPIPSVTSLPGRIPA